MKARIVEMGGLDLESTYTSGRYANPEYICSSLKYPGILLKEHVIGSPPPTTAAKKRAPKARMTVSAVDLPSSTRPRHKVPETPRNRPKATNTSKGCVHLLPRLSNHLTRCTSDCHGLYIVVDSSPHSITL